MIRKGYSVVLLAALAVTGAAITAFACGEKTTTAGNTSPAMNAVAASSNGACTAEMAAKCTPEMAAACKAKGARAARAQMTSKSNSNMAVTADIAADHCAKNRTATAASACCAAKGAKASATTAAAHGSKMKATAVAAGSSCSASKNTTAGYDAVVTGGGAACGNKGTGAMTGNSAHGCDACADMAMCESSLKSAGSQYQVVPLKNGVMYVYTATDARDVRSVQTAISRRTDRINSLASVQGAKLCPDCKRMRGAMASGKLTREVVNIEGGSISLVTSSDPAMVSRLYAMAGLSGQKGVKS